jgi:DNA recombination protein RmuC
MSVYLLVTILALLVLILAILIFKSGKSKEGTLIEQKIDSSSQTLLTEFSKLYEKLGSLDRDSRDILSLTRSFHDILKPTKTRGILGESILKQLLDDVMPQDTVIAQQAFKNGKKVDFAIKLPGGLVPIDAKFSLEAYQNYLNASPQEKERQKKSFSDSVKKRIDETAGYIFPDEGTTDFALMYIPSEAVYYSVVTETNLLDYARAKNVFLVGPNTFYSYLKTILVGFKALQIEKRAKEIYSNLQRLEKDFRTISDDNTVLGNHLRNAAAKHQEVQKRIEDVSAKIEQFSREQ